MDTETQEVLDRQSPTMKKAPRKPRPSEIAAKKAKAKPKKSPAKKKVVKTKRPKPKKTKKRKPAKKSKTPHSNLERLDFRLSKKQKVKILTKAKTLRRTVTSVLTELIDKMK